MNHDIKPSSHTSGPWMAYVSPADIPYVDNGKRWIASLNTDGVSPREVASNTRLIAAAPQLLDLAHSFKSACQERISVLKEECKLAKQVCDETDDIGDQIDHWESLLRRSKQVIDEATRL